jgi:hypothetical protein
MIAPTSDLSILTPHELRWHIVLNREALCLRGAKQDARRNMIVAARDELNRSGLNPQHLTPIKRECSDDQI